jgi:hypothetical protein
MKDRHMRTVRFILLPALMAASILMPLHQAGALEATATKAVDQVTTDLNTDMKVSAFSAAVQAAFNVLKGQVDTFNDRITTLETWKASVDSSLTSLTNRVATLEGQMSWVLNSMWPYIQNVFSNYGSRIGALEARPGRGTLTWGGCYQTAAWYGADVTCGSGYVVMAVCSSGKNADCGGNFTRVTCCHLSIQ